LKPSWTPSARHSLCKMPSVSPSVLCVDGDARAQPRALACWSSHHL
jgi:hypothetical protein